MNVPNYFSESVETVFKVKILIVFDRIRDPGFFYPGPEMEKFGSGINIPDPQHCR
jgi:hypothetical protein